MQFQVRYPSRNFALLLSILTFRRLQDLEDYDKFDLYGNRASTLRLKRADYFPLGVSKSKFQKK